MSSHMLGMVGLSFEGSRIIAMWHGYYEAVPTQRREESSSNPTHPDSYKFARTFKLYFLLKLAARHGLYLSLHTQNRACPRPSGELRDQKWLKHACTGSSRSMQNVSRQNTTHFKKTLICTGNKKVTGFNPFLEDGFIRFGGRLQCAPLSNDLRHSILLDGKQHFVYLLIWQTHIYLHYLGVQIILSYLREIFWILCAREAIKKVLNYVFLAGCLKATTVTKSSLHSPRSG